jgi:hypothetical protein
VVIVHIDGHVIEERLWSKVRPKAGTTLTFTPWLQNGAVLRTVLTVVVAVAALVFAGPLAGTLTIAGMAITGTALSVATALVAGGIILAGTLALNALFPVATAGQPDSVSSANLNSIQGAQNQADPFGPIPVVLGRHLQSPRLAAKWFTELVGDDQYLHGILNPGYGPLQLSDFQIGETPLDQFADCQIEVRQGIPGDAALTLYPGLIDELALSIQLDNLNDSAGIEVNGGDWHSQTTATEIDYFSVDFTATQGIYRVNSSTGAIENLTVHVQTRYRLVGTVPFTAAPTVTFSRSTSPSRVGTAAVVGTRGQYEVQTRKLTGNGFADTDKDTIVWTALRSMQSAVPISFPKPLALIAIRIKATGQLSGVISTFNCICQSLVTAWNGTSWVANQPSQNPADLYRHVLQGPANKRPVPDGQIDLVNLQEWHAYCEAQGFKFNKVSTSVGSVYDQLAEIAAAGRAVPTWPNGLWGVTWDRPDDSIVQHFTPRNSWGFQLQRTYAQQPHGWRVSFINEDNGFTQDERIVYDDGYDASNATLFEGIEFPGVTDPDQIWKMGRYHIAQARLRPEKFSLNVGWEHLVCTFADRVKVTHDVVLIGLGFGRVKSVTGQVVTFDEQVTIEDGKAYGFAFRVPDDARSIVLVVDPATPAGDYTALTVVGDASLVQRGTLFGFGIAGQEAAVYRVQSITNQKDLVANLTLVDDAPEIAMADQGAIPAYDPHVTIPADPFSQPPRDLRYLEVIDGQGASVRALVRLTWQVPRFGNIASFEVQQQDDGAGGAFVTVASVAPPSTSVDVPVIAAGAWSFRVRSVFTNGTVSAWASLLGLNLLGLTFPPGDITNLHQRSVDGQTVLAWDIVDDQRVLRYEVRKGTTWDTGLLVGDAIAQPPWPTTGDGTYHVRAYVLSPFGVRIYSNAIASITIGDSIIARNIILTRDEQALGWPGQLDGGVIDGSFIRTDIGAVLSQPFALEVVANLALQGLHIAVYVSPSIVDIGRAAECRFWTEYEAVGIKQADNPILGSTDVMASTDILGSAPTRFIRAFPIWHFAVDGENDVFAPTDVFAPPDIFGGNAQWLDWVAIATGTRVARFFVPGLVVISDQADIDATGTKFSWFVDVPDRTDDYTDLNVADTGLDVVFYPGGFNAVPLVGAIATPFNGGPNGSDQPHVQRAIVNGTNGDEVKITNLTLAGCTVHVVNAGVNVTRAGVNLLVRGY